MILHGHQVEPAQLGERRQLQHAVGVRGVRREERPELQIVPVIGQRWMSPPPAPTSAISSAVSANVLAMTVVRLM